MANYLKLKKLRYNRFSENISKFFSLNEKERAIKTAVAFVAGNQVEGDYYEFGVFEGVGSFIPAYNFFKLAKLNVNFYAYDSFEGLPEPKDKEKFQFYKGQYSCSLINFKKNLRSCKVDMNKIKLVKGWFKDTLKEEAKGKASIIFVDCDLEESSKQVLNYITPLIQDGTIILFDDYYCFKGNENFGQRKVFAEWLKKNPNLKATEFRKFWWHGESFIINKKKD
jgi:O-methyltransferase